MSEWAGETDWLTDLHKRERGEKRRIRRWRMSLGRGREGERRDSGNSLLAWWLVWWKDCLLVCHSQHSDKHALMVRQSSGFKITLWHTHTSLKLVIYITSISTVTLAGGTGNRYIPDDQTTETCKLVPQNQLLHLSLSLPFSLSPSAGCWSVRAKGPSFTRWDNLIFIDSLLLPSPLLSQFICPIRNVAHFHTLIQPKLLLGNFFFKSYKLVSFPYTNLYFLLPFMIYIFLLLIPTCSLSGQML